ncbi:MAG: LL-diaminopimelate aminotransferase [Chloroflexi bacterium]|nr:MAG: LL-diaminopimelate aminotransferase [Chloroflexota bacterium]
MKPANRIINLPPYPFARLGKRIAEMKARGVDVIRLDIGSPDMPPPPPIINALCRSAHDPHHHGYGGYYGIPALRRAMAAYYRRRFGVTLDPDSEIVPLIGSKEGIVNISLAYLDPGDVALVPDPGYAPYTMGAYLAAGRVETFPLLAERNYLPDFAAIPADLADRAKLIWLDYPNNPTGATAPLEFFAEAVAFAREHDLLICHDAPYCDLTYDGYVAPSILQVEGAREVAIEFNSLSKLYNMAGWRVGMAVGNRQAAEALARVKTNIDSGIFRAIQDAAIEALTGDQTWLQERNAIYQERRDIILDGLAAVGIRARKPQASLYVWAPVPAGYTSEAFTSRLLEEQGVSITPGTVFGAHGEGYVRISLGADTDRIREAMERLRKLAS